MSMEIIVKRSIKPKTTVKPYLEYCLWTERKRPMNRKLLFRQDWGWVAGGAKGGSRSQRSNCFSSQPLPVPSEGETNTTLLIAASSSQLIVREKVNFKVQSFDNITFQ